MSACDGTGRYIGCPGCAACEDEMAALDAAKADALDALHTLAFNTRTRPTTHWTPAPAGDPWATPEKEKHV